MFLELVVDHYNCWSQILSEFEDVIGELISQNISKKYVEASVLFRSKTLERTFDYTALLAKLKEHPRIVSIESIFSLERGNSRVVKIKASRNNNLSDFILSREVLTFKEIFVGGKEIWYCYIEGMDPTLFKEIIGKKARVMSMECFLDNSLALEQFSWLMVRMRPQYEYILKALYYGGYFRSEERTTLRDISRVINESKSNLDRKYKNIVQDLVAKHIFKVNLIDKYDGA